MRADDFFSVSLGDACVALAFSQMQLIYDHTNVICLTVLCALNVRQQSVAICNYNWMRFVFFFHSHGARVISTLITEYARFNGKGLCKRKKPKNAADVNESRHMNRNHIMSWAKVYSIIVFVRRPRRRRFAMRTREIAL